MRNIISLGTLSACAILCASANAYTVTFVSQTITRTNDADLYVSSFMDYYPGYDGASTSFTNSNSSKTATFGLNSSVWAGSNDTDHSDQTLPGSSTYAVNATWQVKSKFKWVPSYPGETPSSEMNVQYDVKIKRNSNSYCEFSSKHPSNTGDISSYGLADVFHSDTSLCSSATLHLVDPILGDGIEESFDGSNSYVDAGTDVLTGISFSLINGEWIGEAISYPSALADLGCGITTSAYWEWKCFTDLEIKYQWTPIILGTASV